MPTHPFNPNNPLAPSTLTWNRWGNEWLIGHARQAQGSGSGKTFVITDDAQRVIGYFSLIVGQIDTLEAPERIRKGMGQYPIPVAILARSAVSKNYQGRGIGIGLLQDAIRRLLLIAEQAGIRAMLTHPIDDEAARFLQTFWIYCLSLTRVTTPVIA